MRLRKAFRAIKKYTENQKMWLQQVIKMFNLIKKQSRVRDLRAFAMSGKYYRHLLGKF
jgi:hypothetical protein